MNTTTNNYTNNHTNGLAIVANNNAAPGPPTRPPPVVVRSGFTMGETTAIAMLASTAVGAILGLVVVTCVLVAVTKQLARLVRVLRGEASVHRGLLAGTNSAPPPDAFAGPGPSSSSNGGGNSMSSTLNSKSILKRPIARVPKPTKSRTPKTDEANTSCAIAEVDEEEEQL